MTPWQLAKDSEDSHQVALFCFAARAMEWGFAAAKNQSIWENKANAIVKPVPELKWLHHIPNGGTRGSDPRSAAIAGGKLKAAGVKAGVLDVFWPLQRIRDESHPRLVYCGLYIEMKKPALKTKNNPQAGCTDEQRDFGQFAIDQGYSCHVCYTWLEAAEILEWYYNLG